MSIWNIKYTTQCVVHTLQHKKRHVHSVLIFLLQLSTESRPEGWINLYGQSIVHNIHKFSSGSCSSLSTAITLPGALFECAILKHFFLIILHLLVLPKGVESSLKCIDVGGWYYRFLPRHQQDIWSTQSNTVNSEFSWTFFYIKLDHKWLKNEGNNNYRIGLILTWWN